MFVWSISISRGKIKINILFIHSNVKLEVCLAAMLLHCHQHKHTQLTQRGGEGRRKSLWRGNFENKRERQLHNEYDAQSMLGEYPACLHVNEQKELL